MLGRLADPNARALLVDLPPGLGLDVAVHLRLPDPGSLTSASGRITIDGSTAHPRTEHEEFGSGSGHAVFTAPVVSEGVGQPPGSETYQAGRNEFGTAGGWNIALFAQGARESEIEQGTGNESGGKALRATTTDTAREGVTSTWMHQAEFRIIASPGKFSIGKQKAVVDAAFDAGYVIRRNDRGTELPAALVTATKDFAERDTEWTTALDQERAARATLTQATQAAQERRAAAAQKQEAEQVWRAAVAQEQAAQRAWWQAKQTYELELARARTEPECAAGPADASITISDDAPTRMRARYALYPLVSKVLEAKRQGYEPRVRYVVQGDLDADGKMESPAKRDFSYLAGELKDKLRIAQWHIPERFRFTPSDVGLLATPQFLPATGPTRIDIWIDVPEAPTDTSTEDETSPEDPEGPKWEAKADASE